MRLASAYPYNSMTGAPHTWLRCLFSRADFLSRFCLTDEVTVCSDAEEMDYSSTAARFHYGHAKECEVSGISRLMVAEEDVLVERRYSFPVGIFTREVKAPPSSSDLWKGQRHERGPHGHDTVYLSAPQRRRSLVGENPTQVAGSRTW